MPALILFRGLQGLAGGVLFPIGSTLIGDLFPAEQRARLQGYYIGAFGLATVVGPQVGGWLVDLWGWRSVFYLNLPLGLLAFALITWAFKESHRRERAAIDLAGAALLTASVALLLLALQQGGNAWAWASWPSFGALSGAAVWLAGFVLVERRSTAPVLDLALFRDRVFSVTCLVAFLVGAGFMGVAVFVPWFMQGVLGVSASTAGSVLTPMMVCLIVAAGVGGQLARRIPYRAQMALGLLLLAAAFGLLTQFTVHTDRLYAAVATGVAGCGVGLVFPLLSVVVQNAFPGERRGVVTSATSFFRSVGSAAGSALFLPCSTRPWASGSRRCSAPSSANCPPRARMASAAPSPTIRSS